MQKPIQMYINIAMPAVTLLLYLTFCRPAMRESLHGTEMEDLLNLQLPCSVPTATLEALVKCIYDDGTIMIDHKGLLPALQLADAIQVREPSRAGLYMGMQ